MDFEPISLNINLFPLVTLSFPPFFPLSRLPETKLMREYGGEGVEVGSVVVMNNGRTLLLNFDSTF